MNERLTVKCAGWRRMCKGTLRGFASIRIAEMRVTVLEVAIHQKGDKAWAQPPAKPWVKDGHVVTNDEGEPQYWPVLEFDNPAVRNAFSDACVRAVLEYDSAAFICREGAVA